MERWRDEERNGEKGEDNTMMRDEKKVTQRNKKHIDIFM